MYNDGYVFRKLTHLAIWQPAEIYYRRGPDCMFMSVYEFVLPGMPLFSETGQKRRNKKTPDLMARSGVYSEEKGMFWDYQNQT